MLRASLSGMGIPRPIREPTVTALQRLPLRLAQDRPDPLVCKWESPSAIAHELRWLTARQQAEVGEDYESYDPDWGLYLAREQAGLCTVWTARTMSGVLVGYILWLLSKGRHCSTTGFAEADLFYLAPEWREGMTGWKFLKTGLAAVKKLPGVDIVRMETNVLYKDGRAGSILKRLGMRKVGEVYRT